MIEAFPPIHLLAALLVLSVAYLVRGIAGFGSGLIAIPLLALILPLPVVVPVIAVLDLLASASHGIGNRRGIQWKEILYLLPFSILGITAAVFLLKNIDPELMTKGLAAFILLYSLYTLSAQNTSPAASRLWALPSGGIGGLVNTMIGTGGPFYVIYLKLRGLGKAELRVTIATVLLLDGTSRVISYTAAGLFSKTVLIMVAAGIPLGALALYVGGQIQTNMSQRFFQQAISTLLLISGMALLLK
jgi:hypothetical protein